MNNWPTLPLERVVGRLIDYRGKTPQKTKTGVKLITAKVIKDGRILDDNHEYIAAEEYDAWMRRGLPQQYDILITTEAPLGEVAQLRTSEKIALAQRIILLRGNSEIIDQNFFFQAIKAPFIQAGLQARATGTTVAGIKQSELRKVDVPLPPLPTQHKIAAILSAYDDLIENNTRRVQVLEQMARALYREWFVEYRFPNHEQAEFVEDEGGRRPKGWERVTVADVALVHRGRSYKKENLVTDGGMPFINLKCIERDGGFRLDGVKRYDGPIKPTQTVRSGDIVMGVTDMTQERRLVARAARIPRLDDLAAVSMDLVKIQPRGDVAPAYLYGMFRFSEFADEVKAHANGANVLHLNPDRITAFEFFLPTSNLRDKYALLAENIYSNIDVLNLRNANLRRTRDLLLPRLVSGELDVSALEIRGAGPEAAAEAQGGEGEA